MKPRQERHGRLSTLITLPGKRREPVGADGGNRVAADEHLVGLSVSGSAELEQYLALRHAIERAHAASGVTVIGVTSATVNDGKTTTVINLAGALARSRRARVLLIDADLRLPSMAGRLGIEDATTPGLLEVVKDDGPHWHEAIHRRQPWNLHVVTGGRSDDISPYDLLQAPRFCQLVAEARREYDYVLLDTPPIVPVPDCRQLETVVDGFLIVVAAHRTPRRLLEEALTNVSPDKVLGLVFNRVDRPLRGYYESYYGYGRPAGVRGDV